MQNQTNVRGGNQQLSSGNTKFKRFLIALGLGLIIQVVLFMILWGKLTAAEQIRAIDIIATYPELIYTFVISEVLAVLAGITVIPLPGYNFFTLQVAQSAVLIYPGGGLDKSVTGGGIWKVPGFHNIRATSTRKRDLPDVKPDVNVIRKDSDQPIVVQVILDGQWRVFDVRAHLKIDLESRSLEAWVADVLENYVQTSAGELLLQGLDIFSENAGQQIAMLTNTRFNHDFRQMGLSVELRGGHVVIPDVIRQATEIRIAADANRYKVVTAAEADAEAAVARAQGEVAAVQSYGVIPLDQQEVDVRRRLAANSTSPAGIVAALTSAFKNISGV